MKGERRVRRRKDEGGKGSRHFTRSWRLGSVPPSSAYWLPAGVDGTHCMVRLIRQMTEMNLCRSHSLLIVGNTSKAQSSLLISLQAKFPKLVLQLPSLSLLVLNF